MADLVLGGIEKPKFLILGDEFCENKTFEEGATTGWTGVGTGALTIDNSVPNFYGDYSALIEDNSATAIEYAYYETPETLQIYKKDTLVVFHHYGVATDKECLVKVGKVANGNELLTATSFIAKADQWNRFAVLCPSVGEGTSKVFVTIHPTDSDSIVSKTGKVRITNLYIREVNDTIQLSEYPTKQIAEFEELEQYSYRSLLGFSYRVVLGLTYKINIDWDYMTLADEQDRAKLIGGKDLFVFPHDDKHYGVFVAWDKDYKEKWAANKLVAHEGEIDLESTELLENKQQYFD